MLGKIADAGIRGRPGPRGVLHEIARYAAFGLLITQALPGCSGEIRPASDHMHGPVPSGAPEAAGPTSSAMSQAGRSNARAGAGGNLALPPASAAPGVAGAASNCPTTPTAAPAPLARLTKLEYQNTLQSLFPGVSVPVAALPDDIVVEGFDNNAKAQAPSPALVEQYQLSAQAVAAAVIAKLSAVLPCAATTSAEQASCGTQFVAKLLPRAFRRPATADELTRYQALFSSAASSYDFATAIGMVVQAAVQSPSFLYRVELGGPSQNGVASLTGYELASRLSYFFWDTAPDDALIAAAASGELDNTPGVETQARRLLSDARAHAPVARLFHQWLRFDKLERMPKSADDFPLWSDQVATTLRQSTSQFVEHVFWDLRGSLSSLLTDSQSYLNDSIAPIYGVTAKLGDTLTLTATDPKQRSGILTQAGLMAAFAHETSDSPVLRGVFIMDRLLCMAPPPPPPGVTGAIEMIDASTAPMTTRDRIAMTHEQGNCAGCHHTIDGYGFGFSHYDAIGRWRETDNGLPVNARGWIAGTQDVDGDFDGAVDLGQRLAKSGTLQRCVASQWYRYALGLGAADVDSCALAPVTAAFSGSAAELQQLMIATATSDAFRHRPEVTK